MGKLTIVGIGYKPLDQKGREALASAEAILGSRRLCEVFEGYTEFAERRHLVRRIDSVDETMRFIREAFAKGMKEIVLLGSGDPLFFGIGRRAVQEFGAETVEIIPDLSSLQMAFSRVKEAWDDALIMSLHAGPDPNKRRRLKHDLPDLPGLLEMHDTVGILTDRQKSPSAIAAFLSASVPSPGELLLYVGERMGYADERVTKGTVQEIAAMTFAEPNVLIIKRTPSEPPAGLPEGLPRFGLKEAEIDHSRGLITKDEVRAVSIHALRLPQSGVLWDIGAGSGALSIEAARLCPRLKVFSIEKDAEQVTHMEQNKSTFAVRNMTVIAGSAPEALEPLPTPDRVFVGGSGNRMGEIIDAICRRMATGMVVINAATLETLNEAYDGLEKGGFRVSISQVSVARSKPLGNKRLLAALNPVFVIAGEKN
jgi:precorrin-6B C5,15-methyltransferase / cobalt-precorrin-6B C5,C15-methyltransferase